jgi:serine/threonine protein kinase
MDLGSAELARRDVATKKDAMKIEDEAAVKCSAPYRAPELTEVKYPCSIDETVDVWSLGCTAYAMAFNAYSPFESDIEGVKRLAILNGKYTYPHGKRNECGSAYSDSFCEMIDRMLNLDNTKRPTMAEVKTYFECIAEGRELPVLIGNNRSHGDYDESVEEDDAAALKAYLKHKESEGAQQQAQQQQQPQQQPKYQQPQAAASAPPPPPPSPPAAEPNLLDFDSFQAPIDAISYQPQQQQYQQQQQQASNDDDFGDFGGFGDFVSASANPSSSFDAFQSHSAPQQQQPQQSYQQDFQPQQQQFAQGFSQQLPPQNFHSQQVSQQQNFHMQQQRNSFQSQQQSQQLHQQARPMNYSSTPYQDPFASAMDPPPPPVSSPYRSPAMNNAKNPNNRPASGLDALNPFENM